MAGHVMAPPPVHILDSDLPMILSAAFPDDLGFGLLATCRQVYDSEDCHRALQFHSTKFHRILQKYILCARSGPHFNFLTRFVQPRTFTSHQAGQTDLLRFAVEKGKYDVVLAMAERGATLTTAHSRDNALFSELCSAHVKGAQGADACAMYLATQQLSIAGAHPDEVEQPYLFMRISQGQDGAALGKSGFYSAACAGLPDVIRYWIQCAPAQAALQAHSPLGPLYTGHTPFTVACENARDLALGAAGQVNPQKRAATLECVSLLASLPGCSPICAGGFGRSFMYWAYRCGAVGLVARWLQHEDVTPLWLASFATDVGPLLSSLCQSIISEHRSVYHVDVLSRSEPEIGVLVGTCGKASPGTRSRYGTTQLFSVCEAGLDEVLQHWLIHDQEGLVAAQGVPCGDGMMTPFALCCLQAGDVHATEESRARAAARARSLASLPGCSPTGAGSVSHSNLYWACYAGLADVVRAWLLDNEAVTTEWMEEAPGGVTLLASLCELLYNPRKSPAAADEVRECAVLVGASGKCRPRHTGRVVRPGASATSAPQPAVSQLSCVCQAGLDRVLQHWILSGALQDVAHEDWDAIDSDSLQAENATSFDTKALQVWQQEKRHHNAFTYCCWVAGQVLSSGDPSGQARRAGADTCARLLASMPICMPTAIGGKGCSCLWWACWAGLVDVVRAWLQHEGMTAEWMSQWHVEGGDGPFLSSLCQAVLERGNCQSLEPSLRACATLVGTSGKCKPDNVGRMGVPELYWVCYLGLDGVLSSWLTGTPQCRRAVLQMLHARDARWYEFCHRPFSIACSASATASHTAAHRVGSLACATLLAGLPECRPDCVGGDGRSYGYWAQVAGIALPQDQQME